MGRYRNLLPQTNGELFLTDGGIETTLIFHEGIDLVDFAAFHLLRERNGSIALEKYFKAYADLACRYETGLILESATWRASPDWGTRLGYSNDDLSSINKDAIQLLETVREIVEGKCKHVVISGCVGPRGDGYIPGNTMSVEEAEDYHLLQLEAFAESAADMASAITMNYVEEAIGVVKAAKRVEMPVVVSFTVETDGNLPTGESLKNAMYRVDAETNGYVSYFMINCAHPSHFTHVLQDDPIFKRRLQGLRANASEKSHAELNESTELDIGNPEELAGHYVKLREHLPKLNIIGGCCGTDHRHVEEMVRAFKLRSE